MSFPSLISEKKKHTVNNGKSRLEKGMSHTLTYALSLCEVSLFWTVNESMLALTVVAANCVNAAWMFPTYRWITYTLICICRFQYKIIKHTHQQITKHKIGVSGQSVNYAPFSLILLFLEQHHSTWTDDTTYKKTTIHLYSCFIAVATNTEMDK